MGVNIKQLITTKEIDLSYLKGRTIGIDAFNWIYQFLSIIRDRETGEPLKDSKGRVTSHLSGILYRNTKLIEAGIKVCYIFDGVAPEFKSATAMERRLIRQEAKIKWGEAVESGDRVEALKAAKRSTQITEEIIETSKELLGYMGIPVIQAPSEGEATCAYLCKKGKIWAGASQDTDNLLFGSPRLVRNLSITGKRRMPRTGAFYELKPELIELEQLLKSLGINQDQLIILSMLVGTDFNPGIQKIGPKSALKLVNENKTLDKVLGKVNWDSQFEDKIIPAEEIFNFFKNPPVSDVNIEPKELQPDKIMKMMVDEHEFSQERIQKVIDTLKKTSGTNALTKWLK
ncbi:MAG: flap endonuclease-1 [Nanoarchaeota archaeon]|nr:flap endonuclease-1 [Nanoarchaeota archaeon]